MKNVGNKPRNLTRLAILNFVGHVCDNIDSFVSILRIDGVSEIVISSMELISVEGKVTATSGHLGVLSNSAVSWR